MTSLWNVYLFRFTFFQEAAMKNKSLDDDIRSKKTPSKKKYQQQMLEYVQQKKKQAKTNLWTGIALRMLFCIFT